MSKSIHTNRKDLKGKTKKQIDEMVKNPDSPLQELAEKEKLKEK